MKDEKIWDDRISYILNNLEKGLRFCLSMKARNNGHSAQAEKEILVYKNHARDSIIFALTQKLEEMEKEIRTMIENMEGVYLIRGQGAESEGVHLNKLALLAKLPAISEMNKKLTKESE